MKRKTSCAKVIALNIFLFIGFFEFISMVFLRDVIRNVNEDYLNFGSSMVSRRMREAWSSRKYPYYYSHATRGFDITPNVRKGFQKVGDETGSFTTWSNGLGCYDLPINAEKRFEIYLAGDSYTWGFASFENTFGQIVENELRVPVASCGVSHTGTRHQFEKFKDIAEKLKYLPSTVIVNVYQNDIENDFLHPHTSVVKGIQLDIAKVGYSVSSEEPYVQRLSEIQIENKKRIALGEKRPTSLIQNLSGTASVLASLPNFLMSLWQDAQGIPGQCNNGYIYSSRKCFNELKGYPKKYYPLLQSFGGPHRAAIADWVQHSKKNNYKIIFSFIDFRLNVKSREEFCKYISSLNVQCWSFGDFLMKQGVHRDEVRWPDNEHFNNKGHRLYANHLIVNLNESRK